jgi:hypothetical protein
MKSASQCLRKRHGSIFNDFPLGTMWLPHTMCNYDHSSLMERDPYYGWYGMSLNIKHICWLHLQLSCTIVKHSKVFISFFYLKASSYMEDAFINWMDHLLPFTCKPWAFKWKAIKVVGYGGEGLLLWVSLSFLAYNPWAILPSRLWHSN